MIMRSERLLAGAILAVAVAVASAGVAQTRSARPARNGPKPRGSAAPYNPYDEKASAANPGPSGAPPGAPADAGPVPAPAEGDGTSTARPERGLHPGDGGRLSPLTPAANEYSDASVPPASVDYDRLLSDIAALRARVAAVSDTMFHSRIAVSLETAGDRGRIASMSVSLDDGVVWSSPASFRAESPTVVYDHAVAPGHHAVTVDVERRDSQNDAFRSEQHSRFIVDVPLDERLALDIKLWDDSNMAGFPSDKQGQYELRVRTRVKAQPLGR
jgi:hypothetical protein